MQLSPVAEPAEQAVILPIAGLPEPQILLSVIIPAFNEVKTLEELVKRVIAAPYEKQIILVDDGSTDGTAELTKQLSGQYPGVQAISHVKNRGKGAAIRTGLELAQGEFCLIQDADLEYDPEEYANLLPPLIEGEAEVVYGSRYFHGDQGPFRLFRYGVSLLNLVVRVLYGVRLTDEATCYKVFKTKTLRGLGLRCERFEFCPEVTAKLCRNHIPIREIPISYFPRTSNEGKKIRASDGWQAVKTLMYYRFFNDPTIRN